MLERAVELVNGSFRGRYIYGGLQTSQPPFELTADGVLYRGDLGHIELRMSDGNTNQVSVNGAEAFGAFGAQVAGSVNLDPVLNMTAGGTMLRDLNGGRGVSPGGLHLVYSGGPVDIDLTSAESLEDVATAITTATGGIVTVDGLGLNGHALTLNDSGGGPLRVMEFNGGSTARDLGILGSSWAAR